MKFVNERCDMILEINDKQDFEVPKVPTHVQEEYDKIGLEILMLYS